ncbi:MAG: diguanylate cyclase [Pseudomonadota bacterium]
MQLEDKPRILIVDDEPTNLQALGNVLKDDYRVQVAPNGEKALDLARREPQPDLILLDVQMPDINGYDVCRQLKQQTGTQAIPIIFVTALDSVGDEEEGFRLGAVDYISKPFHPTIVHARVRTHVSLKKKTDMLERIALKDGLTEIPNRRAFEEHYECECRRAKRNEHSLAVIMLDIDEFKAFNDNYGHGVGDKCLRNVAEAIQESIARPADLVARYGGEEFVVLLPETDATGAAKVAERIRARVESLGIPHAYATSTDVVTISLGVAGSSCNTEQDTKETLLKRADEALYRSKARGRNRVTTDAFQ